MGDYIEREGLLDDILAAQDNGGMGAIVAGTLTRYIKRAPAADVRPVVRGRWLHETEIEGHACGECSACHKIRVIDNFCPNCGADMRGGSEQ